MVVVGPSGESELLLQLARRFRPNAVSFRQYVDELNAQLPCPGEGVSLQLSEEDDLALVRVIDKLFVAWPSEKAFPRELTGGLKAGRSGSVSLDQVLEDVIITTLRQCESPFDVRKKNVLCNGFALGSEIGVASVLRNLDIRSPSTQMQILRSPVWKRLFRLVGHVLFRHLLKNNILLLGIVEESRKVQVANAPPSEKSLGSSFLQLCGPLPSLCELSPRNTLVRSLSNIVLKRDLLYQTATHRKSPAPLVKDGNVQDKVHANPSLRNDGLPSTHILQGLRDSAASARLLMSSIFALSSNSSNFHQSSPSASSSELRDFQVRRASLLLYQKDNARGRKWLKARRAGYKRLTGTIPVLQRVIKRTHALSFRRLLGKYCPLPNTFYSTIRQKSDLSCEDLIQLASTPKDVAKFLVSCNRQMLPPEMLGSPTNCFVFEKAIHTLIRHRRLHESFDVWKFCSQGGFKVTDVPWLHHPGTNSKKIANPTDLQFRKMRLQELLVWLFRGIILPIMHQNFYVTEKDSHRNRLFFFRREIWVKLVDVAFSRVLAAEKQMSILSKEQLFEHTSRRSTALSTLGSHLCPYPVFLYHQLRFVPKRASLRGIQKPKSRMLLGFSTPKGWGEDIPIRRTSRATRSTDLAKAAACMKKLFRHILKVLSIESLADPYALGASVFSLDDVYDKIISLKQDWRLSGCPPLYVCSVDITTSFDTIPLTTLLTNVIPPLLRKERYACIRYMKSKPSLAGDTITQRSLIHVCSEPGEEASFLRIVRQKLGKRFSGSVFTDLVQTTTLTRAQILLALEEFLSNNIVAVPRRIRKRADAGFAVQCRGLPQGHTLSPLLTSLFYAYVENRDLQGFTKLEALSHETAVSVSRNIGDIFRLEELATVRDEAVSNKALSLLMRQVDDTVYVSSSKDKACKFMKRMVEGWETSYGFRVNTSKTRCNFEFGLGSNRVTRLPWCGLIIKTDSQEIMADYSRYNSNGDECLRDCIFIQQDVQAGRTFAERSMTCFKPKLHPILFDGHINTRYTVAVNVYQAALLACLKLCAYATVIVPSERHLSFVVQTMMTNFITLVHRTISCRNATVRSCKFPLSSPEVKYLTVHAFHKAISKRLRNRRRMKARMKACLRKLEREMTHILSLSRPKQITTFQLVADRIAERSCQSLWALRL